MPLDNYVLTGRLAQDGQAMDFPVRKDGLLVPHIRATYRIQGRPDPELTIAPMLTYVAVPAGTKLELGAREVPIPFKDAHGNIRDVRRFGYGGTSLLTDGMTLARINPGVPYQVTAPDGEAYHEFAILDDTAFSLDEERFAFVYDETQRMAAIERGSRIITLPGVVVYPDYCASRLPGWLAKEFNGSPDLGFAYSEFTEPRKGEVVHAHQRIMEPYLGLRGEVPLFVATGSGKVAVTVNTPVKDGDAQRLVPMTYRGEIMLVGAGDVVIPLPNVPHRIQFDGARFPFAQYCINYADRGLDKVPASDRVVLEEK